MYALTSAMANTTQGSKDLVSTTLITATIRNSAGSEQLSVTYLNTFPDQVEGIVFATVRNIVTGSTSVQTATISPLASSLQTIHLLFNGLKSGNYSASIFVESSSGVLLSQTTNSTFTITG